MLTNENPRLQIGQEALKYKTSGKRDLPSQHLRQPVVVRLATSCIYNLLSARFTVAMSGSLGPHDTPTHLRTAALPTVPDHLIEAILEHVEHYSDALALAVTCKPINLVAQPILIKLQFRTISLVRIDNAKLWDALLEKPGLSKSVQSVLLTSLEEHLPERIRCPRSYCGTFDPGNFKWSPVHLEHFCRALGQLSNLTHITIHGYYGANWFPHGSDEVWRAINSGSNALSSVSAHNGLRMKPGGSSFFESYIYDEEVDCLAAVLIVLARAYTV
jgi:hypothetical protein